MLLRWAVRAHFTQARTTASGKHLDAVSGGDLRVLVCVNLHHADFTLHLICNPLQQALCSIRIAQRSEPSCGRRQTFEQPSCLSTYAPDLPKLQMYISGSVTAPNPALACRCAGMTHPQGVAHELARPAPLRMEVHKHRHVTTPNHLLKAGKVLRLHCFYCHCC